MKKKDVLQCSATQGIILTELKSHSTTGAWFIEGFKRSFRVLSMQ